LNVNLSGKFCALALYVIIKICGKLTEKKYFVEQKEIGKK